jgi:hypothetical protein
VQGGRFLYGAPLEQTHSGLVKLTVLDLQLTQQATKYLMKTFRALYSDKNRTSDGSPTAAYIKSYLVRKEQVGCTGHTAYVRMCRL